MKAPAGSAAEYEPIALSEWCNSDISVIGGRDEGLAGLRWFRGLPFLISSGPERAVIVPDSGSVRIEVHRACHRVLVAHRQLKSTDREEDAVGAVVGTYRFKLEGDAPREVAVRQRFEISLVAPDEDLVRSNPPYGAFADTADCLYPRQMGRFDQMGARQTEARRGRAKYFYLWDWVSPQPERELEWMEVLPGQWPYAVVAVTLSHVDEDPFSYGPRRVVVIRQARGAEGDKGGEESVRLELDRGVHTYLQPLSGPPTTQALPAWGAASADGCYVEVAAAPSATLNVTDRDSATARLHWGEVDGGEEVRAGALTVSVKRPDRTWVRTRVVDADTGQSVPCRVRFSSVEGVPYQPHGHHNHVNSNLA